MTLVTAAVVPGVSLGYWTRLAHGDTGLGHSIIYTTNQSVLGRLAALVRIGPTRDVLGPLSLGWLPRCSGLRPPWSGYATVSRRWE